MRRAFTSFLLLILVVEIVTLYEMKRSKTHTAILAETVVSETSTPVSTLSPSPEPTPTPIPPKPTSTPTPNPTRTPKAVYSSEQINIFIDRFSGMYGINPHLVRKIAICESGFNANAVNGPYAGLFQFGSSSWTSLRKSLGKDKNLDLRFNAEEAVQTAAYAVSIGRTGLWPNCH